MAVDIIARGMAGSALKGSGSVPATEDILRGDGTGGIKGIPSEYVSELPLAKLKYKILNIDKVPTKDSKNLVYSGGVWKYLCKWPWAKAEISADPMFVEQGQSKAVTITYKADRLLDDIKYVALVRDGTTILQNHSVGVADGFEGTYTDTITANHKYSVRLTDINDRICESDQIEVQFLKPTYYGFASDMTNLTKMNLDGANITIVTYNCEYDKPVFKWPKDRGALTSILAAADGNFYENYADSFDMTEDGDYYVYTLKDACYLNAYSFCFIKAE